MRNLYRGDYMVPQSIYISDSQINDLKNRAIGLKRSNKTQDELYASYKFCPTRHGCTGATNCDYEYGAPVGR